MTAIHSSEKSRLQAKRKVKVSTSDLDSPSLCCARVLCADAITRERVVNFLHKPSWLKTRYKGYLDFLLFAGTTFTMSDQIKKAFEVKWIEIKILASTN
ncbi:hypothetical protein AVEN_57665-1 [Araneus ventricosus]|uniref:Uncharacterized protein n=1 Tax=Araneus ventricosus TaxID=182803 RepID=A0A4Y2VUL6_ARAVE|nr:hypothetical protein AVEN_57665-1 [Araneus ventricosus]